MFGKKKDEKRIIKKFTDDLKIRCLWIIQQTWINELMNYLSSQP